MDFSWDPFDNHRLAIACDDGTIKLWRIKKEGLDEPTNVPESEFIAHGDKIYFIKFHPTAKDVMASGSYDMTIKIWDLSDFSEKIVLRGELKANLQNEVCDAVYTGAISWLNQKNLPHVCPARFLIFKR